MILAAFRDPTQSAIKSLAIEGGGAAVTNQIALIDVLWCEAGMVSIKF